MKQEELLEPTCWCAVRNPPTTAAAPRRTHCRIRWSRSGTSTARNGHKLIEIYSRHRQPRGIGCLTMDIKQDTMVDVKEEGDQDINSNKPRLLP